MSRCRFVLSLLVPAVVAGLTACGADSSASRAVATRASYSVGPVSAGRAGPGSAFASLVVPSAVAPGDTGDPVRPDAAERKTLLIILEAVDPGMGTNEAALVHKSVAVCGHILGGDSADQVVSLTERQFTNDVYVPRGEQVTAIDMALTATFCR